MDPLWNQRLFHKTPQFGTETCSGHLIVTLTGPGQQGGSKSAHLWCDSVPLSETVTEPDWSSKTKKAAVLQLITVINWWRWCVTAHLQDETTTKKPHENGIPWRNAYCKPPCMPTPLRVLHTAQYIPVDTLLYGKIAIYKNGQDKQWPCIIFYLDLWP